MIGDDLQQVYDDEARMILVLLQAAVLFLMIAVGYLQTEVLELRREVCALTERLARIEAALKRETER